MVSCLPVPEVIEAEVEVPIDVWAVVQASSGSVHRLDPQVGLGVVEAVGGCGGGSGSHRWEPRKGTACANRRRSSSGRWGPLAHRTAEPCTTKQVLGLKTNLSILVHTFNS